MLHHQIHFADTAAEVTTDQPKAVALQVAFRKALCHAACAVVGVHLAGFNIPIVSYDAKPELTSKHAALIEPNVTAGAVGGDL